MNTLKLADKFCCFLHSPCILAFPGKPHCSPSSRDYHHLRSSSSCSSPSFLSRSPAPLALSIISPMPAQPNFQCITQFVPPTLPSMLSPLMLASSTSPPQPRTSPALSEFSIILSWDFIVPSPHPHFFEDHPPPSTPPTCPLPNLPSSPSTLLTSLTKRSLQPLFPA